MSLELRVAALAEAVGKDVGQLAPPQFRTVNSSRFYACYGCDMRGTRLSFPFPANVIGIGVIHIPRRCKLKEFALWCTLNSVPRNLRMALYMPSNEGYIGKLLWQSGLLSAVSNNFVLSGTVDLDLDPHSYILAFVANGELSVGIRPNYATGQIWGVSAASFNTMPIFPVANFPSSMPADGSAIVPGAWEEAYMPEFYWRAESV